GSAMTLVVEGVNPIAEGDKVFDKGQVAAAVLTQAVGNNQHGLDFGIRQPALGKNLRAGFGDKIPCCVNHAVFLSAMLDSWTWLSSSASRFLAMVSRALLIFV